MILILLFQFKQHLIDFEFAINSSRFFSFFIESSFQEDFKC